MAQHSKKPLVSIVLPIYNAEAYLRRTLRLIIRQSCADFELICVDDGSVDQSAQIVRTWADRDARIRLVELEENLGLARARNKGIQEASGTWLWTCDADDMFDEHLLERALSSLDILPSDASMRIDLILFAHRELYVDENGAYLYTNELALPFNSCAYITPEMWAPKLIELEQSTHLGYSWNKLWRLQTIREQALNFEDVLLIEDILFTCEFLKHAQGISCVNEPLYTYMKKQGASLTNANDYTAQEYWDVHERRVTTFAELLTSLGVFDEAKPTLGSLYARYVVSTLERSLSATPPWTTLEQREFLKTIRNDALAQELIGSAAAKDSFALNRAIHYLKVNHPQGLIRLARAAQFVHTHSYDLYTRIRSKR